MASEERLSTGNTADRASEGPTQDVSREAPPDLDQLRAELEQARARAEENLRNWQRTQADFINYRRRAEQERAEVVRYAEAQLILDLLPVLDDLDRAMATIPKELQDFTWLQGIALIDRKLRAILERHGLTPIEALGKEFDPLYHEAVMREDGEVGDQTVVVAELQKGYKLHDRVLRPTLVKVGPARKEEQPQASSE